MNSVLSEPLYTKTAEALLEDCAEVRERNKDSRSRGNRNEDSMVLVMV